MLFCLMLITPAIAQTSLELVESVPLEITLDLPDIRNTPEVWLSMIDSAQKSLDMETFYVSHKSGEALTPILKAIQAAAARGVTVKLLCADWSKRRGTVEYLQSLAVLPHVDVKLSTIPEYSGGSIPYARVEHCKYMVVDKTCAGLVQATGAIPISIAVETWVCSSRTATMVRSFFEHSWSSPYVYFIDPCQKYEAPKTN